MISLILTGVVFSGNLQPGTCAMKSSISVPKSNQNMASKGQKNQIVDQDQEDQTVNQEDQSENQDLENEEEEETVHELNIGEMFEWQFLKEFKVSEDIKNLNIGYSSFNKLLNLSDVNEEFNISRDNVESGEIKIPEGVKKLTLGCGAFEGSSLETFEILSNNIDKLNIVSNAFQDSKLQRFEMLDGIEELNIETWAFDKTNLKELRVPAGVKKLNIGLSAFGSSSIEKFEMLGNIEELNIGDSAFISASIKKFKISSSVKKLNIGDMAFFLSKLQTIEIQCDLNELNIGKSTFGLSNLTELKVAASVKKLNIGENAFIGCQNLKSIEFLGEEISLEKNCFNDFSKLSSPKVVAEFPNAKKVEVIDHGLNEFNNEIIFSVPSTCFITKKNS